MKMETEMNWPRMGSNCGFLWRRRWILRFHKTRPVG